MKQPSKTRHAVNDYAKGILQGDRIILSQAITLIESNLASDREMALELIEKIISRSGNSIRIGITGAPGVGKSTFIEAFGRHITSLGKKIAVLTVDPSSQLTKGSILGDKTRMDELSKNPYAFIRPSPAGNTLGGVAGRTRESILLCEAAGFEIIIVETVGVGQSEVAVKNMVDFFLLLMLAGAGDELQGIKKGITEMADSIVITKADDANIKQALAAQAEFQHALHLYPSSSSGWHPQVLTSSAHTNAGIEEVWKMICAYKDQTETSGYFKTIRQKQIIAWLHEHVDQLLQLDFQQFKTMKNAFPIMEQEVSNQKISPMSAARQLLEAYRQAICENNS